MGDDEVERIMIDMSTLLVSGVILFDYKIVAMLLFLCQFCVVCSSRICVICVDVLSFQYVLLLYGRGVIGFV